MDYKKKPTKGKFSLGLNLKDQQDILNLPPPPPLSSYKEESRQITRPIQYRPQPVDMSMYAPPQIPQSGYGIGGVGRGNPQGGGFGGGMNSPVSFEQIRVPFGTGFDAQGYEPPPMEEIGIPPLNGEDQIATAEAPTQDGTELNFGPDGLPLGEGKLGELQDGGGVNLDAIPQEDSGAMPPADPATSKEEADFLGTSQGKLIAGALGLAGAAALYRYGGAKLVKSLRGADDIAKAAAKLSIIPTEPVVAGRIMGGAGFNPPSRIAGLNPRIVDSTVGGKLVTTPPPPTPPTKSLNPAAVLPGWEPKGFDPLAIPIPETPKGPFKMLGEAPKPKFGDNLPAIIPAKATATVTPYPALLPAKPSTKNMLNPGIKPKVIDGMTAAAKKKWISELPPYTAGMTGKKLEDIKRPPEGYKYVISKAGKKILLVKKGG